MMMMRTLILKTINYITGTTDKIKLPRLIEIQDLSPGEPRYMRKSKQPAILRYHESNKDDNYET